jgi:hypothetical protein
MKKLIIYHTLIILFIGFSLSSCGSKKTEREQYEATTSGMMYSSYKATSKLSVGTALKAYNLQKPDTLPNLNPTYAHILLGYFFSVSGKSKFAFAEAEIVEEDKDEEVKFLAQSLRSITMQQEGWPELAKAESVSAKQHLTKTPSTQVSYEISIFYLVMGSVMVKQKDFAQAKFYWAGFSTETGINWPYQLCDAVADMQAGHAQQGLQKIKVMSQDPAVPEELRLVLKTEIEKVEQHAGAEVDSSLFWPKLIASVLWDEIKTSSKGSLQQMTEMMDGIKKKLPV